MNELKWNSNLKTDTDKIQFIGQYLQRFTNDVLRDQKKHTESIKKLEKKADALEKENKELKSKLVESEKKISRLKTSQTDIETEQKRLVQHVNRILKQQ